MRPRSATTSARSKPHHGRSTQDETDPHLANIELDVILVHDPSNPKRQVPPELRSASRSYQRIFSKRLQYTAMQAYVSDRILRAGEMVGLIIESLHVQTQSVMAITQFNYFEGATGIIAQQPSRNSTVHRWCTQHGVREILYFLRIDKTATPTSWLKLPGVGRSSVCPESMKVEMQHILNLEPAADHENGFNLQRKTEVSVPRRPLAQNC